MTAFRQREFKLFILILFKSEWTISLTKQFVVYLLHCFHCQFGGEMDIG